MAVAVQSLSPCKRQAARFHRFGAAATEICPQKCTGPFNRSRTHSLLTMKTSLGRLFAAQKLSVEFLAAQIAVNIVGSFIRRIGGVELGCGVGRDQLTVDTFR